MKNLNYVTIEEFNNYNMLINDVDYTLEQKYKKDHNLEEVNNDELDDVNLIDMYDYICENSKHYAIEEVKSIINNREIEDLEHMKELCRIFNISVSDLDD